MRTGLQPRSLEPTRVDVQTPEAATAVTPRCMVPHGDGGVLEPGPPVLLSLCQRQPRACEGKSAGRF